MAASIKLLTTNVRYSNFLISKQCLQSNSSLSQNPIHKSYHLDTGSIGNVNIAARCLCTAYTDSVKQNTHEDEFSQQIDKLKADLDTSREETKTIKDKYLRALAEKENLATRLRKQVDDAKLFAIQGFSKDLLDVADSLDIATEAVAQASVDTDPELRNLYTGLDTTRSQLLNVFKKYDLKKFEPKPGDKFDTEVHEAKFVLPVGEPDTIAVVTRCGYILKGRTIRPAHVGVVKGGT